MNSSKKDFVITDLDQPDAQISGSKEKHDINKVERGKKRTNNLSKNFPTRSKSVGFNTSNLNPSEGIQEILEDKNSQMESLVQRILLLYKYNNQFAKENKRLHMLLQQASSGAECKGCKQYSKDREELIKVNNILQNDVSMMKTLVYRLNVQIDIYQEKIRSLNKGGLENSLRIECFDREQVHQWGPLNTETLGPLLNTYEEMIKEKNDLIREYESEINSFTAQLKQVVDENLKIQEEYDVLKKSSNGWLEMKTRLQSQVDSCKSNLDVQTRRADLAKEKLLEVIQCYEQKTQTLSLDLEHLQNAYTRCKQDLIAAKSNSNSKPDITLESLKECKQLFEELKQQHSEEKNDWVAKLEELRKHNADLSFKNEELTEVKRKMTVELDTERVASEDIKRKIIALQRISEKLKKSRDRLKARLKIALQWAQRLEQKHANFENTWEAVKQLEIIVKHKEAQIKGLHLRYTEEMGKMKHKLQQKEETIKNILKSKVQAERKQ